MIIILILGISYCFYGIDYAWSDSRHFWITFNNLAVNNSHDACLIGELLCGADWKIVASVNGRRINLFENANLSSVYDNRTYSLGNKSIDVKVPENSTISIVSTGLEQDSESIKIPDISNATKAVSGIPYVKDAASIANSVRDTIAYVASLDRNDPLGIVAKDFEYINHFGAGIHRDASCLKDNAESPCLKDYVLQYSVREFKPIPNNSLIAELFIYDNYTGPNTIIRNNTASLGSIFHDSVSSIRVYNGPNYRQGDLVEICDRPYFTGNCRTLKPGNYNVRSLLSFNDVIDSIRFVHLNG